MYVQGSVVGQQAAYLLEPRLQVSGQIVERVGEGVRAKALRPPGVERRIDVDHVERTRRQARKHDRVVRLYQEIVVELGLVLARKDPHPSESVKAGRRNVTCRAARPPPRRRARL